MKYKDLPLKISCFDLEIEAINRFRILTPFLDANCQICRELNQLDGYSTILCLDFVDCPQELRLNRAEWQEFSQLLVYSAHYLGLANSIVIKLGDRLIARITVN